MIVEEISQIKSPPLFYKMSAFIPGVYCYLKLEHLNIGGSIKLKPAIAMIAALEQRQTLNNLSMIVSSSSGNLGIALAIICKQKGYNFTCISDPNLLKHNEKVISIYDGKIITVTQKDEHGGYLNTRKQLAREIAQKDNVFCIDQYSDIENINAHYNTTAKEILDEFENIDYLFVGAGTTGTINGCIKYFKKYSPKTTIIAVDAQGSVTYNSKPKKRLIPGLGASTRSEIANIETPSDVVFVKEVDTIKMCRQVVAEYGLLVGGSTGTVLAAIQQISHKIKPNSTVVAISPDGGEKYLDTVYNPGWVNEAFSAELETGEEV